MTSKRPRIKSNNRMNVTITWLLGIYENGELPLHLEQDTPLSRKFCVNYTEIAHEELKFAIESRQVNYIEEFLLAFISNSSWKNIQSKSVKRAQSVAKSAIARTTTNTLLNEHTSDMASQAMRDGYESK